ncbi:MAG: CapA family protein, partial [Candidatus Hydrothermae bacterium]|nr:CapA family protein [Candidatus Hydrothermae bacterium]
RRPMYLQVNGYRVGILAYSLTYPERYWAGPRKGGTAFGHLRWIQKDITKTRQMADFVVVIFHWGRERWPILRPYQRTLAHTAIDAGADLGVGHHPHVLQPVERYHGHTVVYSLGNLLFGSSSLRPEGAVLLVRLESDSVRYRYIPLEVRPPRGGTQPYPLPEPYRTLTLKDMLPEKGWRRIPLGAEWTAPWTSGSRKTDPSPVSEPRVLKGG